MGYENILIFKIILFISFFKCRKMTIIGEGKFSLELSLLSLSLSNFWATWQS